MTELFDLSLATYLYSSEMAEACYDDINDETYDMDGELIDAYRETIEGDASVSRFLVFHLMGQHVDFAARYPWDTYRRFTADSITFRKEPWLDDEMRKDIAHYDNATLYNDAVIRAITQLYADESTVMLYLSDHGEEVFDYRPRSGRDDFSFGSDARQGARYQYCIPFIVWCSEKYKQENLDIVRRLRQSTNRPLMIDNTYNLLFHLAGLHTPYYRADRDVLSDSYHCPPRLLNDDYNY